MKSKFIATLLLSGFVSCTISLLAIAQQIASGAINAQPNFSSIASSVRLGGDDNGKTFEVRSGDVIIIPAGVAHKNNGSSTDFQVVGAYSKGQKWDMNYGKPGERPQAERNIAQVPLHKTDPVYGRDGQLAEYWHLL